MIAEIPAHVAWAIWITAGGTLADVVIRLIGHRSRAALNYAQADEASSQAAVNEVQVKLLSQEIRSGIAAEVREIAQDRQ